MTWVRYDDQAALHRKVAVLDDATYRLWREAIEWSSRNLTDGRIAADELSITSVRANQARAAKLVERELWHPAGRPCASDKCPPSGDDGWVIHDYWQYQFTKEHVMAEKAAKAERQKRWVSKQTDRRKNGASKGASRDASHDGTEDALETVPPSPSPPRREAGTWNVPEKRPAAADAFGAAVRDDRKCQTCGNATNSAYHRNVCQKFDAA